MIPFCPECNEPLGDLQQPRCPVCDAARPKRFGWPRDALIGQSIEGGAWHIIKRIGSGGFAVVYKVFEATTREHRALKVLNSRHARNHEVQRRFWQEIETLRALRHPHIVQLHAAGLLGGSRPYMVLDLIRGLSLHKTVVPSTPDFPQPMPVPRALRIARQITEALNAAHALNLIHRDLNPNNILIGSDADGADCVQIIDYGVAKILGKNTIDRITHHIVGTPEYMAPEQFSPGEALDARLDLWQLGAVMHFVLTGRAPYPPPRTPADLLKTRNQMEARRDGPGPLPSERVEHLKAHPDLDRLVGDLLATDPLRRPPSGEAVLARLRAIVPPEAARSGARHTVIEPHHSVARPWYCPRCQHHPSQEDAETCPACEAPRPKQGWPTDPIVGTWVRDGRYMVLHRLRVSQNDVVYAAFDRVSEELRGLRLMPPARAKQAPAVHAALSDLVAKLAPLEHPNLLQCYDGGVLQDLMRPFWITDCVRGPSLYRDVWPDEARFPQLRNPKDIVRVGLQLASALETLHTHGVVHGDLSPELILMATTPEGELQPCVTGLASARLARVAGDHQTMDVCNDPAYIAPERFLSVGAHETTADLWQLGACLHLLLTGWAPFARNRFDPLQRASAFEIVRLHQSHSGPLGPRPSARIPALTAWGDLDTLVARLLAPDPAERPSTALQVASALARILGDLSEHGGPMVSRTLDEAPDLLLNTKDLLGDTL